MKRILHLIDSWGPGGAETIFVELAAGLDRNRWDGVAVVPKAAWISKALADRGIEPIILPSDGRFNIRYLRQLVRAIRRHRAQVVHTHLFGAALYGSLAGFLTGVPVICTLHGSPDLDWSARWMGLRYRLIRLGARRMVCVSDHLLRDFRSRAPFPENRTVVIHNGVDLTHFRPGAGQEARDHLGIAPDEFVVGTVGNFRPAKAMDDFVRAAGELLRQDPRFRFMIVGQKEDTIFPAVEALARSLGLEGRLECLGFRSDVPVLLRAFDVFVCSSRSEGFSLATIQAMASGVPVVATRSGGPQEIIREGIDGILVDVDAPTQIAEAVLALSRDPQRRGQLREQGRTRVREEFSLPAMIAKYEALYEEVIDR